MAAMQKVYISNLETQNYENFHNTFIMDSPINYDNIIVSLIDKAVCHVTAGRYREAFYLSAIALIIPAILILKKKYLD